jgi:hypothetical protein
MAVYIARVNIAFEADSVGQACDAVSAMLTHKLQSEEAILDWGYHAEFDGTNDVFSHPRLSQYTTDEIIEGPAPELNTVFDEAKQEALA